jgi:tape measure domain-containing protein
MADLSLRIKADFDEALSQFNKLAESSEAAAEKIARFTEKFKAEQIDRFIEKQNMAAVAMQATGRETDAVNSQVAAYQREIERLIKSGLSPQDEALQKLQSEYAGLLIKQDEIKQSTEAEAAAAKKLAEDNANLAAETVKLLDAETDHEKTIVRLTESREKLKKEIQDLVSSGMSPESDEVKNLEGKYRELTKEIEANEMAHKMQEKAVKAAKAALLGIGAAIAAGAGLAIKAAAANEDMIAAFTPLMNGDTEKATALFKTIQKEAASTPFEIDKIAASVKALMPAFGGSAAEATKAFRMLGDTAGGNAQKLETITNAYTKAMLKGKVSMQEINMIAGAGVPIYTELAKSMGITEAQLMEMSKKGQITSDDLTRAFQNMTSEGGVFFKGMETSSDTFNMRLLGIKENLGILAGTIGEKLLPAAKEIAGKVLDAVQSFTEWIQEGDNLKKMADGLIYALAGITAGLTAFLVVTKGAAAVHAVAVAFRALTAAMAANPFTIIAVAITAVLIPALIYLVKNWDMVQTYLQQGIARLEYAFKWFASQIQEKFLIAINGAKIGFVSLASIIVEKVLGAVAKLLDVMGKMPFVGEQFQNAANSVRGFADSFAQATNEARENSRQAIQTAKDQQDAIEAELRAKLNATDEASRARRAELQQKKEAIEEELKAETEAGQARAALANEKVAIEEAANAQIAAAEQGLADKQAKILEQRKSAMSQFFSGMGELMSQFSEDSKGALAIQRVLASSEAAINSYLAFTKTLNEVPFPLNIPAAAGVLASGIAQQVKINSAETGGRFIVPDVSPRRVDGVGLRVNPGEEINVTPRGMAGQGGIPIIINVLMDRHLFAPPINLLAREGELYELQLAGNL